MAISKHSFEPRLGTAQLIFGCIYAFITGIAIVLAFYVYQQTRQQPYTQYFFVLLFAVMASKSFFMYARIRILRNNGKRTTATVNEITAKGGITYVRGQIEVPDYGPIEIESRYAGESIKHELERLLTEQKTRILPALVVNQGKFPRGMFLIKTYAGHLQDNFLDKEKEQQIIDKN